MFGFIAEYTGKFAGYIVDAGEYVWDDGVSAYDKFVEGYESIRPDTPDEKTEVAEPTEKDKQCG